MHFTHPEFFFLLPALIVLGWKIRSLRLHEPLRAFSLLLCVLLLTGPVLRYGGGGMDLWVLLDRSDSCADVLASQRKEMEELLEHGRGLRDRLYLVDYGLDAVRRDQGDPEFEGGTHQTRTGQALDFTLSQLDPERSSRLLLLGDGYSTEPLGLSADRLLRSGVPLDYRFVVEDNAEDVRVGVFDLPTSVAPGEAFLVDFSIIGPAGKKVPWELRRGGVVIGQGESLLTGEAARVRLADRLHGTGAVAYELQLHPEKDKYTQNNYSRRWVDVAGGPRALLISLYPDDPIARLLRAQGFDVVQVAKPEALSPADLTRVRLVLLNNIPVNRLSATFLGALPFFVREQGGGLLMAGGMNSFGSGGYFESPIDPLLPVSMELKTDHRKLATAMAIVLDRSGSMNASAGGGLRKMDLADAGTARAIELLADNDAVSVHAVDTTPHEIIAMAEVGKNRRPLLESVRSIASMGGGIYIQEGLQAGWDELKKAQTGQRHLLLFADANDSAQHPGNYAELLEGMRKDGITVSVIGMGTDHDKDAPILTDVAELGGGHLYFNDDPNELPAVFAQETVSIARSAFLVADTPVKATASWGEIGVKTPHWMAAINGYNLSYLRPGASVSLLSVDEYNAPLVSFWTRGSGRVAAISFPLGGPHSHSIREWAGYGDFIQTLSRWLGGEDVPEGLGLKTQVEGERLTLDLLYDDSWSERVAQHPPTVMVVEGGTQRSKERSRPLVWEKMEPGHFHASCPLTPERPLRGVVHVDQHVLPFGPLSAGSSAEWSFDADRRLEIEQLSQRSGGTRVVDLSAVWKSPRKAHERPLAPWLLGVLALSIVLEAALTRLGISLLPKRKAPRMVP